MNKIPEYGPDFEAVLKLQRELEAESDRGAILVASAMIEEELRRLLDAYFVPGASTPDTLFDGANAPLSSFSAKIDIAYRAGRVSEQLCRDLHLVRKIRNDVAHRPSGCTFEDPSLRDRVLALTKSHGLYERSPKWAARIGTPTIRHQFAEATSWMIFFLAAERARTSHLPARGREFAYRMSMDHDGLKE
ncbi:MAG TPA: hypothetical protein VNV16_03000 [Methylibium sp.]|nr:hypothetical protein [Methylibium sp.]